VDPRSAEIISFIGLDKGLHPDFGADWNGGPFGIPYIVVSGKQPKVPVTFDYDDESDPGPYPIPANPPIEGGSASDGDRHILIVDADRWILYELFAAYPSGNGWRAGSGAIWDLNQNSTRPPGGRPPTRRGCRFCRDWCAGTKWSSATLPTRSASRFAGPGGRTFRPRVTGPAATPRPHLPPMGMRVRLKASFDISGYPRARRWSCAPSSATA
jgi:hypothetical protein